MCLCVWGFWDGCISFTWPPGYYTMCLRRKQHAIVLFMVLHVSLGAITVAQPWVCASSKEGKNIFPFLFCPAPLSIFMVNYRCLSLAAPFYHPHPKVGPNPLSSLKAGRQQLAQGDQFRLEREVRAASSPWVPPIFCLYCWGAAVVYLDPMSGAYAGYLGRQAP